MAYMTGAETLLTHSIISGNTESGNTGGIGGVSLNNGARMEHCTLYGNKTGSQVDAVSALYMASGSLATHCVISNNLYNSSTRATRTVYLAGGTLRNCLIVNNPGTGLAMAGGVVESCTIIANNVYGDVGNGLVISGGTLRNSIVWDNGWSSGFDNDQNVSYSGGVIEHSLTYPALDAEVGTGNLSGDPLLLDAAAGDYRLKPASPCVGTGLNQPWMVTAFDLAGEARKIGARVDIGAYECTIRPGSAIILR